MWIVRICLTIFLVAWTSQVWAQGWLTPQVNFGTTRLNWQESVELKTSQPSWEVKVGTEVFRTAGIYNQPRIYSRPDAFRIEASVCSSVRRESAIRLEDLATPITVNGQTFGKKDNQKAGQAQAGQGAQETVVVDTNCSMADVRVTIPQFRSSFAPVGRLALLNLSITAQGKIDGKQVEVSESITRYYPQLGLAYNHRQGAALVTLLGTVGQRSSHLEANLNWNIRPDAWVGVGGKRSYFGFEQGRVESAVFTVKAGVVF